MKFMLKGILFILGITVIAFAQIDRSVPPAPGPAPEIKIGDYQSFKLKNDLQVFVIENHKLPRVALALAFRLDPVLEGDHAGYVMLTGQMLRKGTKRRTKEQLDEEIDFIGGTLVTTADFIYGSALKRHFEKLLTLFSDVTLNAEFKQDELEKLKKQTISGIAFSKDKPDMIADRLRRILDFGLNHPYGNILTEESVNSITLEMCQKYYAEYFSPDHAYLAVIGDITLSEAKPLVTKYFKDWEAIEVPFHQYKMPKAPKQNQVALVDRANSVQSSITITYPIRLKLGSRNQVKSEVLNKILGGGSTGRLFLNLREDKGFTYGAYSTLEADPVVGYFAAKTEVRTTATDSAVTEILKEMNVLREKPVSEDDLQLAKNYLSGEFARSLENPQTLAQFALNVERYWMPKDYYKNYLKNVETVTVKDAQDMAKKYLTPDKAHIIIVGKAEEIVDKIRTFNPDKKIQFYTPVGKPYSPEAYKAPEGITAEKIIENYIRAIGGRQNLEKMKDITIKAQSSVRGRSFMVMILKKAPNKLATKMEFGGSAFQKTIYDGNKGVTIAGRVSKEIVGNNFEALKFEAEMNGLLNLDKLWISTELVGEETIDERDVYKVKFKPQIGYSWLGYYDKKTGLQIRQEKTMDTPNGILTQMTDFDDYRVVDGVMFPFEISQRVANQEVSTNVIFININQGIEDSEFEIKL